jgi:long-subunit fatty acid transport protein
VPTLRGSLVFGLAYNTTKDFVGSLEFSGFNNGSNSKIQSLLDTDIPYDLYLTDDNGNTIINGRLNQSGNMLNSGSLNQWTLTGAIEAYKNLFIGANISVVSGSFNSDFDYYEDDTQNIYQGETAPGYPSTTDFRTFYLKNLLKWDIEGWNAKLGFLYQLPKLARIGLTIQFPKVYKINEDFNVEGKSEFAGASVTLDPEKYSDKVKYDITTPYEISGGASVNLKGLIISGQATYIDYKEMEFSNGEGISPTYFSDQNKRIKNLMRPVVNYNLGAEYTFSDLGFRVRGGFILQPSAFKNDPSDFDKKFITAGLGFLSDGVIGIDIAYAYGWWKDFGDNYDSNVSRTYQDITYHKVMLTTSYRF